MARMQVQPKKAVSQEIMSGFIYCYHEHWLNRADGPGNRMVELTRISMLESTALRAGRAEISRMRS
jgi:hypothetical protein